ncbi:MAG: response regulator [Deltaproteobacteria bacterium]|nr:response regulator [Deltaproteobacteria bacterium]
MGEYKIDGPYESEEEIKHVLGEISRVVHQSTGIQLGEKQFSMVKNRLKSYMIKLGIPLFTDYFAYFNAHKIAETEKLVSLMTTHHTYFFREFNHFEFLIAYLPELVLKARASGDKKISIWSAACSRGQEVYSLALFFQTHLKMIAPDISYEILGTDVDSESVNIARNGVYAWDEVKKIPMQYLGTNWTRGTGDISHFAKIKDEFKKNCQFDIVNLNDIKLPSKKFDFIFCRNVFIYFNMAQIKSISKNLMSYLKPEGLFFIGISESLNGVVDNVDYRGPSIYANAKKATEVKVMDPKSKLAQSAKPSLLPKTPVVAPAVFQMPSTLKVLCVDDSPTILALLKKILGKDSGFEVVGTALNGKEAIKKVSELKPDLVTLDIHMPEMDGIDYLKSQMNDRHPPVVMISSINRENSDTAMKSIELGASDYVEKPTMANLEERSDEIRSKLKLAFAFKFKNKKLSDIDSSFKKKYEIKNTESKLRIVFSSLSSANTKVALDMVKNIHANDPSTVFVYEGVYEALAPLVLKFNQKTAIKTNQVDQLVSLLDKQIYITDLEKNLNSWAKTIKGKTVSVLVLGMPSKKVLQNILEIQPKHLTLEEMAGNVNNSYYTQLKEVAQALVPANSYLSVSEDFFVKNEDVKK